MEFFAEASGWLGALAVLAGYAGFSMGWITDVRFFQACNLAGSAALLINGCYHGALPSVVLNAAWACISTVAMVKAVRSRRVTLTPAAPTIINLGPSASQGREAAPKLRGACVESAVTEGWIQPKR
ncbi:hypothetical protein ACIPYU_20320 [Paenarthrobacter nicotinovorans]|uniref:CBU_0592 family membrane protein n=1 Tax=Paenarthrobacter nicotinovorans TaxID=29320 RepID=UPI0037F16A8B